MDLVLIVVTVGALALAAGLSIVGWKLLQQDRAELDARVESLRTLAAAPESGPGVADVFDELMPAPVAAAVPAATAAMPMSVLSSLSLTMSAATAEPAVDWDTRLGATFQDADDDRESDLHLDAPVFGAAPASSSSGSGRRGLIVAAVAVVMVATAGTAYAVYRPATATSPRSLVPVNAVPLELLSLAETTDADGAFVVTGLIGNPSSARPAEHVVAVVYLFDRDGHYFATGRAAIDLGSLAPGNQSPFVVKVPHGAGTARYRVGFREPDGSVVAHVDKRGASIEGTTEGAATSKGTGQ